MNFLFPKSLNTPHIPLGISINEGLTLLKSLGEPQREDDNDTPCYRVNAPDFSVAIYEKNDIVESVWYDDPLGRIWNIGKRRKIKLYLERFGNVRDWEERMDNGWMKYFFNPKSKSAMVYGRHMDVIRFNRWEE